VKLKPIDEQVAILMHGAEFGDEQIKEMMTRELRQRLIEAGKEGRPLRVYCGYDVTAPDIHLGHTITMRKLRWFQEFGHDVTFLIGTFTTLIGDPSDRDEERSMPLTELIEQNALTYAEQAFKILDREKTSIRYNNDWLSKLTFADVIRMASHFTVQQFLVRDRLRNRYDKNEPLWLRELLYPLAQGYDAVHLQTDVQIGGTEQLFNLMAADQIVAIQADLEQDRIHPMEAKKKLAWEIVDTFNGSDAADAAAAHFEKVHQAGEFPTDMPTFTLKQPTNIIDLLAATALCKSKGEARRVVQQGGVRLNGEPVGSADTQIEPNEAVLQRGKRHFVRLVTG